MMKERLAVRPMTAADIDAVVKVEEQAFVSPWSRAAFADEVERNDVAVYLVLEAAGQVVGYAGVWIIGDEAHVTNVALLPECRGRGWGKRLFGALMLEAWQYGACRMTLEVRPSNRAARQLYKHFGFAEAGRRKGYYSDNQEDALILWQQNIGAVVQGGSCNGKNNAE